MTIGKFRVTLSFIGLIDLTIRCSQYTFRCDRLCSEYPEIYHSPESTFSDAILKLIPR